MRKDVQRFLKGRQYRDVRLAFDKVLDFDGFWDVLQLGCLRRIFTLSCFEVNPPQGRGL
jgi:Protein of unknown function (DUF3723)